MEKNFKERLKFIKAITNELGGEVAENRFCHYTSLPILFNILDKDECWISNARFSNDSTEELLLGDMRSIRDDYIMCFCDSDDQLSQWRGYCHNGGVSIEFYFREPLNYSILWADYKSPTDYEIYENRPLPVIYFKNKPTDSDIHFLEHFINAWKKPEEITLKTIWPYVKNDAFSEERELRMVFANINGNLDKCIRFRTLDNGVKIPYMVIKCGDIGKMLGKCATNISMIDNDFLQKHYDNNSPIWIEEGNDQNKIYEKVKKKVDAFLPEEHRKIHIYCKGHLPIMNIKVAPSDNQERVIEQIKRFCRSKYWLRDVKVLPSEIPYVQSLV